MKDALRAMRGTALDIGGTRARLVRFQESVLDRQMELWLPGRAGAESPLDWGRRRVAAIARWLATWEFTDQDERVATACAGRKDPERKSVVESTYASPLPDLVETVREHTGREIGPLFDDDVCAGWGHLYSSRGGLETDSVPTVLLTAGTGLAECLWVDGAFLTKGSYPRVAELGLEDALRAESWRSGELPVDALSRLLEARQALAPFRRLVLSGRFAEPNFLHRWPKEIGQEISLEVCPLGEAPALGALALSLSLT